MSFSVFSTVSHGYISTAPLAFIITLVINFDDFRFHVGAVNILETWPRLRITS